MKRIIMICLLSCLMFLTCCNKDTSSSVNDKDHHTHTSHNYQKPGANVRLTHNYDGATNAGEVENLSLTLIEQYSSGQMYIQLKPDTSLAIEPETKEFIFSMEGNKSHNIDLSIRANSNGKHLLNIFASVMDNSGRVSNRIMAIAFYVGDKNLEQSKIKNSNAAEKVIILPSQVSGGDE